MNSIKRFLGRWKAEYDFKTYTTAAGSLAVTLIFAFYNGFLGVHHASLWHGTICVYYILLTILRGSIIAAANRVDRYGRQEDARDKAFLAISFLLLILNISLVVPISIMVRQQKPVSLTLIPAIAMAAYTTYKVIMASVNLRKRKPSSDSLVWLLRTISFIDALVSILTLQNTLIMVNSSGEDLGMLPLTAITSALVWIAVLGMSLNAIMKGIRKIRNG
ncbi:MAG TPA: hypothetical protein PLA31_06810 [Clostridia bacterium]|nr:hypothetical protein [Clostridia bacterium]